MRTLSSSIDGYSSRMNKPWHIAREREQRFEHSLRTDVGRQEFAPYDWQVQEWEQRGWHDTRFLSKRPQGARPQTGKGWGGKSSGPRGRGGGRSATATWASSAVWAFAAASQSWWAEGSDGSNSKKDEVPYAKGLLLTAIALSLLIAFYFGYKVGEFFESRRLPSKSWSFPDTERTQVVHDFSDDSVEDTRTLMASTQIRSIRADSYQK